jgi:D-alanyl-D-alanine carboxypeptidase (penicillin-binding protein 5/6)
MIRIVVFAFALGLIAVGGLLTFASEMPGEDLGQQLQPLIDQHKGKVAVAIKHLNTGEEWKHQADEPMPTASLIKFPLMVAAYQAAADETLDLDQMVTLEADDKVPGSGILTTHFSPGAQISLRDAVRLMIAYSDNTATNLVAEQTGLDATAKRMEALGLGETKLHSFVFKRDTTIFPQRSKKYGLGSTTANEMIRLLQMLHEKKLVSPEACDEMLAHLYACEERQKLSRFLPKGTRMAHKSGSVNDVRCEAGIVDSPSGPIAVCVLTSENEDQSWGNENAAEILCGKIAEVAYQHFQTGEDLETAKSSGAPIGIGATGPLVIALQRTLNARLDPSPELGVDGDFGPATQSAVLRFQEVHKLAKSGEVGAEMWKALGPLITEDNPVPAPDVVNSAKLDRKQLDPLDGPPFVTCKGWAIGDGKTGKLLWGENADKSLDPASTTKIMTGYLVALLAERDPSVLEEKITFSKRADETIGSTADVRAGEVVTVGELLYGLMLPSGNDASVAFGEHFGNRLLEEIPGAERKRDALDNFVTAMNYKAKELGLGETSYENTHGLTMPSHKTSPRNLLTLAWHAMQLPSFCRCTNTRQRGCQVTSTSGYTRNLLWKNTNQLLGIEGYDGVKTGTTNAAGACLVSRGNRGDRQLILVVLGSAVSDSRYTDSRNLYRWAWQQLETESNSN